MTVRMYSSPEAFKQALERRLRTSAKSGAAFARKRQLLVFARFLALVSVPVPVFLAADRGEGARARRQHRHPARPLRRLQVEQGFEEDLGFIGLLAVVVEPNEGG